MKHAVLPLALVLATAAVAQTADYVGPSIGSMETGIFCGPEVVGHEPAPDTVAGVTNIIEGDPPFISRSRQVPAVLGMGFGIKAQAKALDQFDVLMTVTHPPMGDRALTRQSYYTSVAASDRSLTSYQFDYDYELVEGDWTFEATNAAGEVLYRVTFTVVPPEAVPQLAAACGYEDLLS